MDQSTFGGAMFFVFSTASALSPRSGCVELPDQSAEQAPEIILTRIAADAADFAAIIDQDEQRRQLFNVDEGHFLRQQHQW